MEITKLDLQNFRIYCQESLTFGPGLNVFFGQNAQGKTNLVEAIYVVATGKSFRTNSDKELCNWSAGRDTGYKVQTKVKARNSEFKLLVEYDPVKGKRITFNETSLAKRSELLGFLTVVIFTPEDLNIVKGGPSHRRRFIDLELAQINPSFRGILVDYTRVLRQRNNLLKQYQVKPRSPGLKEVFDLQLTDLATRLLVKRVEALQRIAQYAGELHQNISNQKEKLALEYVSSFPIWETRRTRVLDNTWELAVPEVSLVLAKHLKEKEKDEIIRGSSLFGPHRDDLNLLVNGKDVRAFGSQGQQRTAALALKLAELEYMKEQTGEYPVLLLDDVLSELDIERRKYLMNIVQKQIQIIVTSTDLTHFDAGQLKEAELFRVRQGRVIRFTENKLGEVKE